MYCLHWKYVLLLAHLSQNHIHARCNRSIIIAPHWFKSHFIHYTSLSTQIPYNRLNIEKLDRKFYKFTLQREAMTVSISKLHTWMVFTYFVDRLWGFQGIFALFVHNNTVGGSTLRQIVFKIRRKKSTIRNFFQPHTAIEIESILVNRAKDNNTAASHLTRKSERCRAVFNLFAMACYFFNHIIIGGHIDIAL